MMTVTYNNAAIIATWIRYYKIVIAFNFYIVYAIMLAIVFFIFKEWSTQMTLICNLPVTEMSPS